VARGPLDGRPVMANEDEQKLLTALKRLLAEHEGGRGGLVVVGPDGDSVPVPPTVAQVLTGLVRSLANGQAVKLVPFPRELTVFEAAEFLGESASVVEQLLAEGQLPLTGDEAHRRIRLEDAVAYRTERDARRREALRRLTEINQELGLYSTR
jgi:hypothetical protein